MRRLLGLLAERAELGWLEALGPRPTIVEVLSTLLALLELAKRGAISLAQSAAFTSFVIRREKSPEDLVALSLEGIDVAQASGPAD
jgi:chromatin segregation and condensation protein Rec8/ScpA/Scc1 (kleisin family)